MTNGDRIREMSNDELVSLLVWGMVLGCGLEVPDCDEGCEDFGGGCANGCPHEKQEQNVRRWLEEEYE